MSFIYIRKRMSIVLLILSEFCFHRISSSLQEVRMLTWSLLILVCLTSSGQVRIRVILNFIFLFLAKQSLPNTYFICVAYLCIILLNDIMLTVGTFGVLVIMHLAMLFYPLTTFDHVLKFTWDFTSHHFQCHLAGPIHTSTNLNHFETNNMD